MKTCLTALNARLSGRPGAEPARVEGSVLTAYVPQGVAWDEALLEAIGEAIRLHRAGRGGVYGLLVEIGSGSVKLLGRIGGATIVNVKLEVPRDDAGFVAAAGRLVAAACGGLRRLEPADFDLTAAKRLFAGFGEVEDFAFVYATHGLRVMARQGLDLPGVRVLSGDEEGLLAFEAIVPPDRRRPDVVAVEIGSGSTEIVRVAADGVRLTLTLDIGGRSQAVDAIGIERAVAAFTGGAPGEALLINPSGASAVFRAFAGGRIDAATVKGFAAAHPGDAYVVKARILLAVARGLGVERFSAGRGGGLKLAVAEFVEGALKARLAPLS